MRRLAARMFGRRPTIRSGALLATMVMLTLVIFSPFGLLP